MGTHGLSSVLGRAWRLSSVGLIGQHSRDVEHPVQYFRTPLVVYFLHNDLSKAGSYEVFQHLSVLYDQG